MVVEKKVNPAKDFIAGGVGGVCTVFSGHPFDTIKVRLQTMPVPGPGQSPMYSGAVDCVKKTVTKEGVRGLFKGMGAPMMGAAPVFALSFMGNGLGKKLVAFGENRPLTLPELMAAGGFSGILTTVIMAPGERIKCILQVQQGASGPPKYSGPVDVVKSLFREGGIRSVYKGTVATLLRDVPASAAYFGSYEMIQRVLAKDGDRTKLSLGNTIFAGGMAGIFNWMIGIAPDVLKSRLQTAPAGKYNGVADVFRELMRTEGPKALFKGAVPVMARAFPANACCFMGYESALYCLNYLM